MESAPPAAGGRARVLAMAIGLLAAGCSGSATERCEDGSYCPEGTRCGGGAFCLVEEASCADFEVNARCVSAGDAGARFCAPGGCQDGVSISGRLALAGSGGAVEGARVAAVDRAWMEEADTDSIGGFALDAVQNDADLVLRMAGNEVRPSILTRRLTLGAVSRYEMNGDAQVPLRVPSRARLLDLAATRVETPDPSRGAVVVSIGSQPGNGIRDATATLEGSTGPPGIYFNRDGNPVPVDSPQLTSAREPNVVFVELEPGTYSLTASHPLLGDCRGAGADLPVPVVVDVRAGELTNAGWMICR